jgi:poly-beta-1,6-N-acetyl-D-glucosamine synthase
MFILYILALISAIYFCSITWTIIGFILIKEKGETRSKSKNPQKITVIVPVRNEKRNIINCLRSLENQSYNDTDFEIIIVNDHSTDSTLVMVNNYIKESEYNIKLYDLERNKTSKKEALKYGVEKSNYEIIATTDADCILPKEWLNNISEAFSNEINMLLGPVIFKEKNGFLSNFQTLDMLAIQGLEFGALGYNKAVLNNAANLSYSKNQFYAVDGFDDFETPSGDDIFLLEKFKQQNKFKIRGLLRPDFVVETASEKTFASFINQRLRWSSKAKYYKSKLLILLSVIILLQNTCQLFIYYHLLFIEKYKMICLILLLSKWLIDFILLFLVSSFFERKKSLLYFIPVQLVYPIYIVFVGIASRWMKFEWKDREFNG